MENTETTTDILERAIAEMTRKIAVAVVVRPREAQTARTMLRIAMEIGR